MTGRQHTMKKLPPHSPFLNIVEQEMVLIRAEIIHMSKFKPGNIINYRSYESNLYAFAMPVQCSYHQAKEVADKSRRNVRCIEGSNACE